MSFHLLTLLPAITGGTLLALGAYVLARNFRSRPARVFFNFSLFYFLTALTASLLRLAPHEGEAEVWARLFYFFHVAMVSFLLGAITAFLRAPFFHRTSVMLVFQILAFTLGISTAALIGQPGSRIEGGGPPIGFYLEAGPATLAHSLIGAAYTTLALGLLLGSLRRAQGRYRLQLLLLTLGLLAPAALGSLTALLRLAYFTFLPPIANFGALTTALCLYTATLRLHLWVVPTPEELQETAPRYRLEPRSTYLVEEPRPDRAYDVFKDQVTHGVPGLIITRQNPEMLRRNTGLQKVPILHVTSTPGDYHIDPREPADLVEHMVKFVKQSADSIILLDCFEYLVAENNFKAAFSNFNILVDLAQGGNARVILTIAPGVLPPDQMALLKKYTLDVKKSL